MHSFDEPIFVTRPTLPPLENLSVKLEEIWRAKWLTNNGVKVRELERRLKDYLGVPQLSLFNNGTTALMVACRALGLTGEVITTPFTFAATPHALTWNNLTPVFCDIDPITMRFGVSINEGGRKFRRRVDDEFSRHENLSHARGRRVDVSRRAA